MNKIGTGKCSCLKVSNFSVGDRVRVVYIQPSQAKTIRVGDNGAIQAIYRDENIMVVYIARLCYAVYLRPQNIVRRTLLEDLRSEIMQWNFHS